jgi:hypothetical protein
LKIEIIALLFSCCVPAWGSGLVAEYKFDGGLFDTGSDGDAADNLSGSQCVYADGISGSAVLCNSNTFTAVDSADLDLPPQYTIEVFIKPLSLTGLQCVFSKNSYSLFISDSNLIFYHTQSDSSVIASSPIHLTLNRWQHIAVTADGGTIIVYLNGSTASVNLYNGTVSNSASPLSIGSNSGSNFYHGFIDEIRMFSEVKNSSYIYSRAFYTCGALQKEDIDGDCKISLDDFSILADQWLLSENS